MVRTKFVPYNSKTNQAIMPPSPKKRNVVAKKSTSGVRKVANPQPDSNKKQDSDLELIDLEEESNDSPDSGIPKEKEQTNGTEGLSLLPDSPVIKLSIPKINVEPTKRNTSTVEKESSDEDESNVKDGRQDNKEVVEKKGAAAAGFDDSDSGKKSTPPTAPTETVSKSGRVIKKPEIFVAEGKRRRSSGSSEEEEENKSTRRKGQAHQDSSSESKSDDSDADFALPKNKKGPQKKLGQITGRRPASKRAAKRSKSSDDDKSESDENTYIPNKKVKKMTIVGGRRGSQRNSSAKRKNLAESSASEGENSAEEEEKRRKRGRGRPRKQTEPPRKSGRGQSAKSESEEEESDEEEDKKTKTNGNSARASPRKLNKSNTGKRASLRVTPKSKRLLNFSDDSELSESEDESKKSSTLKSKVLKSAEKPGSKRRDVTVVEETPIGQTPKPRYATTPRVSLPASSIHSGPTSKLEEDEEYIDLKKLHLTKQIELMNHEIYCRKLDALTKEQLLKLERSSFTIELTSARK